MVTMMKISGLSKKFNGKEVVEDLSFELDTGDVLGFLGPNGAGKSTSMRMITGYLIPDRGEILLDQNSQKMAPYEKQQEIGYMPENAPLYPDMMVGEFLTYCCDLKLIPVNKRKENIERVITLCHLEEVYYQSIYTLSKGFKRRVSMGQSLLGDPHILIWDEPTDGLDPNQKNYVRKLIKDLSKSRLMIISTHSLEEVRASCNKIIVINHGRKVFEGDVNSMSSLNENQSLEEAFHQLTLGGGI